MTITINKYQYNIGLCLWKSQVEIQKLYTVGKEHINSNPMIFLKSLIETKAMSETEKKLLQQLYNEIASTSTPQMYGQRFCAITDHGETMGTLQKYICNPFGYKCNRYDRP